MIYYFTGQPGAGKTTLGKLLFDEINDYDVIHIDGDELRELFNNMDYSIEGRRKNIELAHNLIRFLHFKNFNVIVTMVSPFRDLREQLKSDLDVMEFYVHTTSKRRQKFHVDYYEPPLENFHDIDTTDNCPEESFDEIINLL